MYPATRTASRICFRNLLVCTLDERLGHQTYTEMSKMLKKSTNFGRSDSHKISHTIVEMRKTLQWDQCKDWREAEMLCRNRAIEWERCLSDP